MAINLEQARNFVNTEYLSKPYTNRSFKNNWQYKANGHTVERPNHGLVHTLRAEQYVRSVIEYYQTHAKDPSQFQFTEDQIQKMELAMLFSVVGRENDAGWSDDYENYSKFKKSSGERFDAYCKAHKIFNTDEELQEYKHNLLNMGHEDNPPPLRVILDTCHKIDLMRCFYPKKVQTSIINYLNRNSNDPNNSDIKALLTYAQQCMKATGDKITSPLRENVNGIEFNPAQSYQPEHFVKASLDVATARQQLATIERPSFSAKTYSPVQIEPVVVNNPNIPLTLIKEAKGMIRLVNAQPNQDDLDFNLSQFHDPVHNRPLRSAWLDLGDRKNYRDQKTQKLLARNNKALTPLNQQAPITEAPGMSYYEVDDLPVNRAVHLKQEDRGQPQNTIFTKKMAYSLIRPDGKIEHFKGTGAARHAFLPVGILCNVDEMHTKGERYIWLRNVQSNEKFWVGDEALNPNNLAGKNKNNQHRGQGVSLAELQAHVKKQAAEQQSVSKFNEALMGGSQKSIKALFATEDSYLHRLNLILSHLRAKQDYQIDVPMLIVDGQSEPRAYTESERQADLKQAVKNESQHGAQSETEKSIFNAIKSRISMTNTPVSPDITQAQFTSLLKEMKGKRGQFYSLNKKKSLTQDEKSQLALLRESLCISSDDTLNFKEYLNKKGYSSNLNQITFGIDKLTVIPSSGDGTPVQRGSNFMLKNMDLSGLEFNECRFNNVDLSHSLMKDSRFISCQWSDTTLRSCNIANTLFRANTFNDVDFSHAKITHSRFSLETKHNYSTFFDTTFDNVRNFNTQYEGCNFIGAKLSHFKGGKFLAFKDCVIPETLKSHFENAGKIENTGKSKIGLLWKQNMIGHTAYKIYQDTKARGAIPVKIDYDPNHTDIDLSQLPVEVADTLATQTSAKPIPQVIVDAPKHNIQAVMKLAQDYTQEIDGLILTGGLDIEPHFYTPNYNPATNPLHDKIDAEASPFRSLLEFGLIKHFSKTAKPLFGICRGNQMVNAYYGGNVHQDLPSTHNLNIRGVQNAIEFDSNVEGGLLHKKVTTPVQKGYACHHQAVNQPGEGLQVIAKNQDLPYAFENEHGAPVFLTQFHPEVCQDDILNKAVSEVNDNIFKVFHEAIDNSKQKQLSKSELIAKLHQLGEEAAVLNGDSCIKPSQLKPAKPKVVENKIANQAVPTLFAPQPAVAPMPYYGQKLAWLMHQFFANLQPAPRQHHPLRRAPFAGTQYRFIRAGA